MVPRVTARDAAPRVSGWDAGQGKSGRGYRPLLLGGRLRYALLRARSSSQRSCASEGDCTGMKEASR